MARFLPAIFFPSFTWPHRTLGQVSLATEIPSAPSLVGPTVRRLVGCIHEYLARFSIHYCKWCGVEYNNQICELPFGLLLKHSDGTRLEEVAAIKVARAAGFPAPLVMSYGDHADMPHAPVSILMTRLPGQELSQTYGTLGEDDKERIFSELKQILEVMRSWKVPPVETPICSILGTSIRSVRVPFHKVGPCKNELEFNQELRRVASEHGFKSREQFEEKLTLARHMDSLAHDIVFTHGDFKPHNVLVHQGHVSGLIDWESAGWYPNYWEFTTGMRMMSEKNWWYKFVFRLGGSNYMTERECERALNNLTVDSYAW